MNVIERKQKILNEHMNRIEKDVSRARQKKLKPYRKDIDKAIEMIMKYVKEKKRIIYGGTAQNMHVVSMNESKAFYNEVKIPDIDFYSPEPLKDLIELSDMIYEANMGTVYAKEAQHDESYTIFFDTYNVVDITYVPRIIYNNMPTTTFDGIRYIAPEFFFIDIYRIYTDPLTSFMAGQSVIKKAYKRMITMESMFQKDFPNKKCDFEKNPDALPIIGSILQHICKNRDYGCIVVGDYAFNQFAPNDPVPITRLDIIAPNIQKVTMAALVLIKKLFPEEVTKVKVKEYRPYFQFLGRSIELLHNDRSILYIMTNNNKCIPYKELENDIYIGSFHMMILYLYIFISYSRTHKLHSDLEKMYCMIDRAFNARNEYLRHGNKLGIEEDTIYQELQIECLGKTVDPRYKHFREISKKKVFTYNPKNKMTNNKKRELKEYKGYANTSGNIIENEKHRLIKREFLDKLLR